MTDNLTICPKCNTKIIRNNKICYRCGEKLQTGKRNTRTIAILAVISLLIICLIIYTISIFFEKSKLQTNKNVGTIVNNTVAIKVTHVKKLQFASFSFIKADNSETVARAFITENGFAAIPLEYFKNLKEIVWKEDGRETVIDSGIYWQTDAPFVLLKVPYENQENSHRITKWDTTKPILWKRDNSEVPEALLTPQINISANTSYVEIDFLENRGSGLFIQDKHIVGWTFSFLKNKGYLWVGIDEQVIKPNIELSTLEVLLNSNLYKEIEKMSINDEKAFMIVKNLSSFFIESKSDKNWNPIIIYLIEKVCLNSILEKKYKGILAVITPALLLRSCNIVLLDCYAKANEAIYGYEMTISLLEKLKNEMNTPAAFSNNITSLIIKTYTQRIEELLYYEKYDDAIKVYNIAIVQYPTDQDLKISGIEAYIKLKNWQKAEEILTNTVFDSKYIKKLKEYKKIIADIKASENKIIIKFLPNAQKNIFVNSVINEEVSQKFILDTGASLVSIPSSTANRLGIDVLDENYTTRTVATASGIFKTKEVILHSLTINGKKIYNIPAVIIDLPQDKNLGLLGMSFLSKFHMELNNEKGEIALTLKEKP